MITASAPICSLTLSKATAGRMTPGFEIGRFLEASGIPGKLDALTQQVDHLEKKVRYPKPKIISNVTMLNLDLGSGHRC